jgi:hypothetical protein
MSSLIVSYSDSLTNFMEINNSMYIFFQKNKFNEEEYEKYENYEKELIKYQENLNVTHLIKNDTNTIKGGGPKQLLMILFAILTLTYAIIPSSLVQIKKVHAYTTSTQKLLSSIKDVKDVNDVTTISKDIIFSEYGAKITKEIDPGFKAGLFRTIILNAGKLKEITNIRNITLENVLSVMKITVCTLAIVGKVHPTISLATNTLDMGLFAHNALIDSLSDDHHDKLKKMLTTGTLLGGKSKRKKIIFNKTRRKKR